MKNHIPYLVFIFLMACSGSSEKSDQQENQNSSDTKSNDTKSTDFVGRLELTMQGESYEFTDMTRVDSRVSFQEKAIAVYITNTNGEGTIAQITIMSPLIYNSTSHTYVNDSGRWLEGSQKNDPPKRTEQNLQFKFRRIDNMDEENYINLDQGTANLEYDDEKPVFRLSFEGKDMPSAYNDEDNEEIAFSGKLILEGAYLMDSRD